MVLSVEVKNTRELKRALDRFGEDAKEAVRDSVRHVALETETEAKKRAPANFNRLRSAIRARFSTDRLVSDVGVHEGTRVNGQLVNYSVYVEKGTQGQPRKFPPRGPIELWAKRVLGDASAWYPVALKIYEEGTPAQPFLEPAFDIHGRKLNREITKRVRRLTR